LNKKSLIVEINLISHQSKFKTSSNILIQNVLQSYLSEGTVVEVIKDDVPYQINDFNIPLSALPSYNIEIKNFSCTFIYKDIEFQAVGKDLKDKAYEKFGLSQDDYLIHDEFGFLVAPNVPLKNNGIYGMCQKNEVIQCLIELENKNVFPIYCLQTTKEINLFFEIKKLYNNMDENKLKLIYQNNSNVISSETSEENEIVTNGQIAYFILQFN